MRVLRCPVGLNPQVVNVETFEDLRRHCGDMTSRSVPYITRVTSQYTPGFDCWCDEDGGPKGLPLNMHVNCHPVLGTFVLSMRDNKNEALVREPTDGEIAFLKAAVERWRR